MDPTEIAGRVDGELRAAGSADRAAHEKRYLKSELEHYGVPVPEVRRIARAALREIPALAHRNLVAVVEALWRRRVHECRTAAVELLDHRSHLLEPGDIELVERMIRESKTWALVDGLAASVAGGLVERYPELRGRLDRWAEDDDFWVRRSALLALLGPLRRGDGDVDRFFRYADSMLDEREFFIRKAIGWVLRETGKKRPDVVSAWLEPRARRAAGLTVREAVKHLSEEQREAILTARGGGTG